MLLTLIWASFLKAKPAAVLLVILKRTKQGGRPNVFFLCSSARTNFARGNCCAPLGLLAKESLDNVGLLPSFAIFG